MFAASRRLLLRAAGSALVALTVASVPGCALFREIGIGGDDAKWQTAHVKGISPGDVLRLAQTAVQNDFPAARVDAFRGEFETGWVYGLFDDVRRAPLRQRIVIEAKPQDDVVLVRLRAQQEMNETAGRLASASDDGWEKFEDDPVRAQTLFTRLCILIKGIGEIVPEKKEGEEKS
jgi:hypothetical protein